MMYHDLSDLESLILIQITPNEHTLREKFGNIGEESKILVLRDISRNRSTKSLLSSRLLVQNGEGRGQ